MCPCRLRNFHDAVLLDRDRHTVFYVIQEFLAQGIDHRHVYAIQPYVRQYDTGTGQRIDGIGKQHACGLAAHRARAVDDQSACSGADGLRQAQCLAGHLLTV